jgi:hypothetical protein
VRGVELRAGKVRQMRAEGGRIRLGPAVPAPAGRRVELRLHVGLDGALTTRVRAGGGRLVPVPAGPARAGTPPTRVAVSCRGTGAAVVARVRARPFD